MIGVLHQNFVNIVSKCGLEDFIPSRKEKDLSKSSSLGIKYPTLRDHPLHTAQIWLDGKRADDESEGLWRIHDSLYDFEPFVKDHPGGRDWLDLTKGTDITEAFESHHISSYPEGLLKRYLVRKAKHPRNYPFTFAEDGFYRVLKKRIHKKLQTVPKNGANRSKFLTDMLFFSYIVSALLAVHFKSFILGFSSGIFLSLTAIAAHNFFHQKDNIRMYYFDFTFMQSRDWRVTHALSHHLYTNTINDFEISSLEPFIQYLPTEKNIIVRNFSWAYSPVVYAFAYLGPYIRKLIHVLSSGKGLSWDLLLPFVVPILMWLSTKETYLYCIVMYLWIITVGSIYFAAVGVNAAHHHPDIFHDGDTPRPKAELDWGIHQLDAVMDRKDITGSHFLVLTNFGDHALHHLFPTVDHGLLEYLYPVFLETCEQFGIEWKLSSQIELVKGQFQQMAKTKPNKNAPKPPKKTN